MRCRDLPVTVMLMACALVAAQTPLPDGPGKQVTVKICGGCHGMEAVIAARRTRMGWNDIIDDMITRGAKGSDENMVAVLEYLTSNFGKVNVNTATTQDLQKELGLSEAEARAIVAYRDQNGKIKDFDQLSKVEGANSEKLREKRMLIAF